MPFVYRTELITDLGYQLSFSVFDEASATDEWTSGHDLRLAEEMPNVDVVILAVRQVRIN